MERIWLDDSVCARSFPHTTSACRGGVTPSNRRLAASLSFSKCQRSNSRRTSFLCVTFVAMSTPPSRRMLRHPPLIPPIRLERHRPDRPESKPPHAVGAHIGRHPGLVRVAQAHAVHGTRAPPAAQIARMHILRHCLSLFSFLFLWYSRFHSDLWASLEWLSAVSFLGLRPHGRDVVGEMPDDPFDGCRVHLVVSPLWWSCSALRLRCRSVLRSIHAWTSVSSTSYMRANW